MLRVLPAVPSVGQPGLSTASRPRRTPRPLQSRSAAAGRGARGRDAARRLVLLGLAGQIGVLLVAPAAGLRILWGLVVPLLPVVFLVSPVLWRNLCPFASLDMGAASPGGRVLPAGSTNRAAVAGIASFGILVPTRLLLLDAHAGAAACLLAALGATAALRGRGFQRRAGFCHSLCPMLPVERLYGQAPVLGTAATRCPTCVGCTARGCLDLSPAKSIPQVLGPSRHSMAWLRTPFGVFAAAFPGFVAAYGLAQGSGSAAPLTVYGTLAAGAAAGYGLTVAATAATRTTARSALPVLAAVAAALFYWQAAPGLVRMWDLPASGAPMIRLLAVVVVAGWLRRALRKARERSGPRSGKWVGEPR